MRRSTEAGWLAACAWQREQDQKALADARDEALEPLLNAICAMLLDHVEPKDWSNGIGPQPHVDVEFDLYDLLVKHGRVTKDGDVYRWRKP